MASLLSISLFDFIYSYQEYVSLGLAGLPHRLDAGQTAALLDCLEDFLPFGGDALVQDVHFSAAAEGRRPAHAPDHSAAQGLA